MDFDFKTFSAFVTKAYKEVGNCPYSLRDVLSVFECYFEHYEAAMGETHPFLKLDQIKRIIRQMPYMDTVLPGGAPSEIEPEEYPDLIDQHFRTEYSEDCDYRINHFFSGMIRELRYYERIYSGQEDTGLDEDGSYHGFKARSALDDC